MTKKGRRKRSPRGKPSGRSPATPPAGRGLRRTVYVLVLICIAVAVAVVLSRGSKPDTAMQKRAVGPISHYKPPVLPPEVEAPLQKARALMAKGQPAE